MILCAFLLVAGLAACGSNVTEPSSPGASGSPAASAGPTATAPSATASARPGESPRPSARPTATPRPTPTAIAGSVDACALVPAAELSAIVGGERPVASAMSAGGWIAGQCAWSGPTTGFFLRVGSAESIAAFADPSAADAAGKLRQFVSSAGTTTKVPDVGDGAELSSGGMGAVAGGAYLEIMRLNLSDEELTAIMKLAIANLL